LIGVGFAPDDFCSFVMELQGFVTVIDVGDGGFKPLNYGFKVVHGVASCAGKQKGRAVKPDLGFLQSVTVIGFPACTVVSL
jgi:hypothetical protein